MTFYVENETHFSFPFDVEEIARQVADTALKSEGCPCEVQLNLILTDKEGIRRFNREYRGIDKETDVISFPNLDFASAGDFRMDEARAADYFDPDTGEMLLGDIVICVDRVKEQANAYGHSEEREFAFLVAHSIFHLCGYDHMTEEDACLMERKQEAVLTGLGMVRTR
ncbi:MAG: rRNA maturation RNase YbeY [Candidatus Gastranaerophilales bacterium]|nr:rRNA maturation RNase YbeY [Candidatus Gastranaerophilales bacterium]